MWLILLCLLSCVLCVDCFDDVYCWLSLATGMMYCVSRMELLVGIGLRSEVTTCLFY